jgi:hypothetical protein
VQLQQRTDTLVSRRSIAVDALPGRP